MINREVLVDSHHHHHHHRRRIRRANAYWREPTSRMIDYAHMFDLAGQ
ncbi:hypothetical protein [Nocardia aurea]|nr:hypothetical protein [Nocardia aurea]